MCLCTLLLLLPSMLCRFLPYIISVMWPLLILVSSPKRLGAEWLTVEVCSASNRRVMMDKTGPTEGGSVTRGFCPDCAAPCTDLPPLSAPPQEYPFSARQVKAGGSEGRPGGCAQTQTQQLEMLLLFFSLFLSLVSSLPFFFCFITFLPPRLFHSRKLVYLWKEIKKG